MRFWVFYVVTKTFKKLTFANACLVDVRRNLCNVEYYIVLVKLLVQPIKLV